MAVAAPGGGSFPGGIIQMEADIRVEKVHFAYNGAEIIRGIDLNIKHGAFHCLLGPNGSGKTTLVKLLSGVLKPTSGRIELFGESLKSLSLRKIARRVAVVPQGMHVSFPFTALEIVLMGRAPHLSGLSLESRDDMTIAQEAMEMTGMWELRHRVMEQLSGGEAQRVIVARALAQQPKVLLLDEPTVFLDIKHQIELMELLTRLHQNRALTILAVTHDLNLAALYAEKVTLLRDGIVRTEGLPHEVITPKNIMDVFAAQVEVFNINGKPGVLPAPSNPEISTGNRNENLKENITK